MSHDLSFNTARLDLVELDWALRHGLGQTRKQVERELSSFQHCATEDGGYALSCCANRLQECATSLKIIANSLHYVNEAINRDNVTFTKGDK